jgi:hypothetical protein
MKRITVIPFLCFMFFLGLICDAFAALNFGNSASSIVLNSSVSRFASKPVSLIGWKDRSITKQQTGVGQGDYNILQGATGGVFGYTQAPVNAVDSATQVTNNISVENTRLNVLGGISGTTNLSGRSFLNSPIDLSGGTLTLGGDLVLSSASTIVSSGQLNMRGFAMVLGGDLKIPTGVSLVITSSGIIDGQGNSLILEGNARLQYDNYVSLTLRNLKVKNVQNRNYGGSLQGNLGVKRYVKPTLILQNSELLLSNDYSCTAGKVFIVDDVKITGSNQFNYTTTQYSTISRYSTLMLDMGLSFLYGPQIGTNNDLIIMQDSSAGIVMNGCTLKVTTTGLQLTKGSLFLDHKNYVYNQDLGGKVARTDRESFVVGNLTAANDLNIHVLPGGSLEIVTGRLTYNNVN